MQPPSAIETLNSYTWFTNFDKFRVTLLYFVSNYMDPLKHLELDKYAIEWSIQLVWAIKIPHIIMPLGCM